MSSVLSGLRKRVKQPDSDFSSINELVFCSEEIKIGDCCVFQLHFENSLSIDSSTEHAIENVIIGTILGFRYIEGKTAKDRRYHKDTAILKRKDKDKGIEAFSNWYTIKEDGTLFSLKTGSNSFFVPFEKYLFTVKTEAFNHEKQEISLLMNINHLKSFVSTKLNSE